MKKHYGIKPQDIVIVLFVASNCDGEFKVGDVAKALNISQSEVSEGLKRARSSKLINQSKKVFRLTLFEFLIFGIKVTFPVAPGSIARGVPTAHSGPPLNSHIVGGDENYVWKDSSGNARGMIIDPLYKTIPKVAIKYPKFYELLCLVDAIRIGRAREVNLARQILKERLIDNA